MWAPRTWADVQAVLDQVESRVVDFKSDLPAGGKAEEVANRRKATLRLPNERIPRVQREGLALSANPER